VIVVVILVVPMLALVGIGLWVALNQRDRAALDAARWQEAANEAMEERDVAQRDKANWQGLAEQKTVGLENWRRAANVAVEEREAAKVKLGVVCASLDKAEQEARTQRRIAERLAKRADPLQTAVVSTKKPEWTDADVIEWRKFVATSTGRKFLGTLQFGEQAQNRSAVLRTAGFEYNCGFAAGYHALAESIFNNSAEVRPQQDDTSTEGEGATSAAELHAP